jgi:putative oxygen-independent coproporphyrinogen III oxidase
VNTATEPFGVYVHVPFCAHRCDYCDFATWTDRSHLMADYVDACVADLDRRRATGSFARATSVFFGGGTPSLLDADLLVRVLEAIPREPGAEVTVECNPDSVDAAKLSAYRRAGVDRLSFGVQSSRAHVLATLGRTHDRDNVARSIDLARDAGFARVSVDLIYGTPGETIADWCRTLDDVLALAPDHVSAYALTVEPATPLGKRVAAGASRAPDDDDQADKYEIADDRLAAAGFQWYEISNWALPGQECRHNLLYWTGGDYLGIGCAAHGYTGGRRWWTVRTPEQYIERVAATGPDTVAIGTEAGSEMLTATARAEEAFALTIRLRQGVAVAATSAPVVRELAAGGLLEPDAAPGRAVLTRAGRLMGSDVTARLLLAGAATRDETRDEAHADATIGTAPAGTRYH